MGRFDEEYRNPFNQQTGVTIYTPGTGENSQRQSGMSGQTEIPRKARASTVRRIPHDRLY